MADEPTDWWNQLCGHLLPVASNGSDSIMPTAIILYLHVCAYVCVARERKRGGRGRERGREGGWKGEIQLLDTRSNWILCLI